MLGADKATARMVTVIVGRQFTRRMALVLADAEPPPPRHRSHHRQHHEQPCRSGEVAEHGGAVRRLGRRRAAVRGAVLWWP